MEVEQAQIMEGGQSKAPLSTVDGNFTTPQALEPLGNTTVQHITTATPEEVRQADADRSSYKL
jgi:hypothetical protein